MESVSPGQTELEGAESPPGVGSETDEVSQFLLDSGRLRKSDLKRAEAYREQNGGDLVTLMVRLGLVSERDVAEAESNLLDIPMVSTGDLPDEPP